MSSPPFKYRAFISYSRADRDHAVLLRKRLEQFVLPKALQIAGPGFRATPRPLRPIFRDEDELVPGQNLPARIRAGLEQSEYLIVLCSPAAAQSEWVAKEIHEFATIHDQDKILAIVVAGEPHSAQRGLDPALECLPAPLRHGLMVVQPPGAVAAKAVESAPNAEPLWVDWRASAAKDRNAFLRLVAALLALSSFDELVQRDAAYRRRQSIIRWVASVTIVLGIVLAALLLASQVRQRALVRSSALVDLAEQALGNGNAEGAARFALLALRDAQRPLIGFNPRDAEVALAHAMLASRRADMPVQIGPADWLYTISRNGLVVAAASPSGMLRLWDTRARRPLGPVRQGGGRVSVITLSANGRKLALARTKAGASIIEIWDVRAQRPIKTLQSDAAIDVMAFSPDATLLATGSGEAEQNVDLWNIANGARARNSHREKESTYSSVAYSSIAFSDDGTRLAAASGFDTRLYSVPGLAQVGAPIEAGALQRKTVAPDSYGAFIGTAGGELVQWSPVRDEEDPSGQYQLGMGPIKTILPDGMIEFESGRVRVWPHDVDWRDRSAADLFPAGMAAMMPNRRTVVSVAKGEVRFWTPFPPPRRVQLAGLPRDERIANVLRTRNGFLVPDDGKRVLQFDAATLKPARIVELKGIDDWWPYYLGLSVISADGRFFAFTSDTGTWLVEMPSGRAHRMVQPGASGIKLALAPDGEMMARLYSDNLQGALRLDLWDTATRRRIGAPIPIAGGVETLGFTPDGKRVLLMSADAPPRFLDIATRAMQTARFPGYRRAIFSWDGSGVMTEVNARNVYAPLGVFDAATGKPLETRADRARFSGPDEDTEFWEWSRGLKLTDLLSFSPQEPGSLIDPYLNYGQSWITPDRRHFYGLAFDGGILAWDLGRLFDLHGQALAREVCRTLVPGYLARLTEDERKAAAMSDENGNVDVCQSFVG